MWLVGLLLFVVVLNSTYERAIKKNYRTTEALPLLNRDLPDCTKNTYTKLVSPISTRPTDFIIRDNNWILNRFDSYSELSSVVLPG